MISLIVAFSILLSIMIEKKLYNFKEMQMFIGIATVFTTSNIITSTFGAHNLGIHILFLSFIALVMMVGNWTMSKSSKFLILLYNSVILSYYVEYPTMKYFPLSISTLIMIGSTFVPIIIIAAQGMGSHKKIGLIALIFLVSFINIPLIETSKLELAGALFILSIALIIAITEKSELLYRGQFEMIVYKNSKDMYFVRSTEFSEGLTFMVENADDLLKFIEELMHTKSKRLTISDMDINVHVSVISDDEMSVILASSSTDISKASRRLCEVICNSTISNNEEFNALLQNQGLIVS